MSGAPADGFQQALDKVQADQAPPGAPPPKKASTKQAGEVASKEQKTPSQKPDSPPEAAQSRAVDIAAAKALVLGLVPAASLLSSAPVTPSRDASGAEAVEGTDSNRLESQAAVNHTPAKNKPDEAEDPKEADAKGTSSDEEDDDNGEDAISGPKSSVSDAAHPDLGKVTVTVTRLGKDADPESGTGAPSKGDKSSPKDSATPNADTPAAALDAISSKTAPGEVAPTPTSAPISGEQRDLAFRQVSDRLELLSASRPREAVTINLHPTDLGSVTVVLKSDGGKLAAELFASHDGVRDALKEDANQMASHLQARGVAMSQVTVSASAEPRQTGSNTHYQSQSGQNQAQADSGPRQNRSGDGPRPRAHASGQAASTSPSSEPTRAGGGLGAVDLWI
jgi:chemotaxis protein MotD